MKSVISEQFFNTLGIPFTALKKGDDCQMITANHSKMRSLGVVDLTVSIQGLAFPYQFTVLKDLAFNIILGLDILNDCQANIDFSRQTLTMFDGLVSAALSEKRDRSSTVVLQRDVVIPPHSEALVPVLVNQKFNSIASLIETLPQLHSRFLAVAAAIVKPVNCFTTCRMINLGVTPRRIRKFTPIAHIQCLDMNDAFKRQTFSNISSLSHTEYCAPLITSQFPCYTERVKALNEV